MPYGLSGSGTASCTTDVSGATGWVNVTFSYAGTDQRALPCAIDHQAEYRISGIFTLNDGATLAETPATLKIATTAPNLLGTRTVVANFDLPEAAMKSSLWVSQVNPLLPSSGPENAGGLLSVVPCLQPTVDKLVMSGSFDIVKSATEALEYATGASSAYAMLPPEVQELVPGVGVMIPDTVKSALPGDYDLYMAPTVDTDLDAVTAVALGNLIDTFASAFGLTDSTPGLPSLAEASPYLITVKYKTAVGSQTIQAVGAPGVATPVLVPNANNSMIPEQIIVTVTGTGGYYSLKIERTAFAKILPIDVKVAIPPVEDLSAVTDMALELGFEGLSVVGGAPDIFRISTSSTSSDNSAQTTAELFNVLGNAPTFDVVGRYKVLSEGTDLSLRIKTGISPTPSLSFDSQRAGKKRTLAYGSKKSVPSISLTGSEKGKELRIVLSNIATDLAFCSDKSNGCVLPWRVYQCACSAYGTTRYIFILGQQIPIRGCTEPQYCPLAAENSASFTSSTGGVYSPTTLNVTMHNPSTNSSGTVVSDDVVKVTNLALSQFGFDKRTGDYPKRIYFDTRSQQVNGRFEQATYGQTGARQKLLAISGGFRARDREFIVKKKRFLGVPYYTIDRKGSMTCSGFDIDSGGEFPGWVESAAEYILCH